jgi:Tfp pilus assembly protein PilF
LLSIGEIASAFEFEAEFEKAASYYRRALDLSPNDRIYRSSFISFLIKTGRLQEATDLLKKATIADPEYPGYMRCRALIHASRGERDQALKLSRDPEILSMLGMQQDALRLLEQLEGRSADYQYQALSTNPHFEILRGDPRYQAILARQDEVYKERIRKYGDLQ